MEAIFDAQAASGVRGVYEFRVDGEVFHARIEDQRIEAVHGPAQRPDAVIEAPADVFLELAAGRLSLEAAISHGSVEVSGDRRAVARLAGVFRWPGQPAPGA
jgi:putative sterol carrier protein